MTLNDEEKELLLTVLLNAREDSKALALLMEEHSHRTLVLSTFNDYRDSVIALHAKLYKELRGRDY